MVQQFFIALSDYFICMNNQDFFSSLVNRGDRAPAVKGNNPGIYILKQYLHVTPAVIKLTVTLH